MLCRYLYENLDFWPACYLLLWSCGEWVRKEDLTVYPKWTLNSQHSCLSLQGHGITDTHHSPSPARGPDQKVTEFECKLFFFLPCTDTNQVSGLASLHIKQASRSTVCASWLQSLTLPGDCHIPQAEFVPKVVPHLTQVQSIHTKILTISNNRPYNSGSSNYFLAFRGFWETLL